MDLLFVQSTKTGVFPLFMFRDLHKVQHCSQTQVNIDSAR